MGWTRASSPFLRGGPIARDTCVLATSGATTHHLGVPEDAHTRVPSRAPLAAYERTHYVRGVAEVARFARDPKNLGERCRLLQKLRTAFEEGPTNTPSLILGIPFQRSRASRDLGTRELPRHDHRRESRGERRGYVSSRSEVEMRICDSAIARSCVRERTDFSGHIVHGRIHSAEGGHPLLRSRRYFKAAVSRHAENLETISAPLPPLRHRPFCPRLLPPEHAYSRVNAPPSSPFTSSSYVSPSLSLSRPRSSLQE